MWVRLLLVTTVGGPEGEIFTSLSLLFTEITRDSPCCNCPECPKGLSRVMVCNGSPHYSAYRSYWRI